jgi:CRISPR-associated protein Cas1
MKTVYVIHDGATLGRDGEHLVVRTQGRARATVPTYDASQVAIVGNVVLTPGAIDLLTSKGIDTVLLTKYGRYRGRITSGASANVRLRIAQVRLADAPERALDLARRFVRGKVANQRVLLQRFARRHGLTPPLERAIVALRASTLRADRALDVDELRGVEGNAAAQYFAVLGELVRHPELTFDGRTRRPPTDPINALLSLGYTLLANAVEAAIEIVGLDPYVGVLHAPQAGRPSLVCDMQEELRAPLVDPLVLAAVNQRALGPDDFDFSAPEEGVTLTPVALRWFVRAFERRLARATLYEPTQKRLPFREVIVQQARRLARHVLGTEPYEPFTMR